MDLVNLFHLSSASFEERSGRIRRDSQPSFLRGDNPMAERISAFKILDNLTRHSSISSRILTLKVSHV